MDLSPEHMKAICSEIRLDYGKMLTSTDKGKALLYLDSKFAYLNSKHNVENLMIAGWLLCKHWDDTTQGTELWHIINPELKEEVPSKEVILVLNKLAYIAVDLNLNMINALPNGALDKPNAIKYLQRVKANK